MEELTYGDYTGRILYDAYPDSPRVEGENLGKMRLDRLPRRTSHMEEVDTTDIAIDIPVYIYSHSGDTISVKPFSCPWDSWRAGSIVATRQDILKAFNKKRLSKKMLEQVRKVLEWEVETYDMYLRGEVYSLDIYYKGEQQESCHNIYGEKAARALFEEAADVPTVKKVA